MITDDDIAEAAELLALHAASRSRIVLADCMSARSRRADVMAYLQRMARQERHYRSFATEICHLQRTEVREVEEPFAPGRQKRSGTSQAKSGISTVPCRR